MSSSTPQLYQKIFELKSQNDFKGLIDLYPIVCQSELLAHEISYALGQIEHNQYDFLKKLIQDKSVYPVVRHESIEALANSGRLDMIEFLMNFENDEHSVVRDSVILGIQKIKYFEKQKQLYGLQYNQTIEPACPFSEVEVIELLGQVNYDKILGYICDKNQNIFNKYRLLYFLRNKSSNPEAILTLAKILQDLANTTELMRHEVCFIVGQAGQNATKEVSEILRMSATNPLEKSIVRHEAIGAFQTVDDNCDELLEKLSKDPDQIVRETAEVALYYRKIYIKQ